MAGTAATEAKIVDTQTSYVVPLQFDLFNEKNKPLAIRYLVENIKKHNYTLTTSFYRYALPEFGIIRQWL